MTATFYPAALAIVGGGIILAYWLPRFVSGREPAASALLIIAGCGAGIVLPPLSRYVDPTQHALWWQHVSELALIIGLFGTGLRIDDLRHLAKWTPTLRLLAVGMPLTIVGVTMFGWFAGGLTLAASLLLGAVMAPTDPVLAGDVQVGAPMEGAEHPVRFTLTAEAGLNDGLAFPFVHLALAIGAAGAVVQSDVADWLWFDVAYRVVAGIAAGAALGWLLGRIMFDYPRESPLARSEAGVVSVAGILVCYGVTEALSGYGFIACFVAGLVLRRSEARHDFHRRMHSFTDTIEHALTAALLVAIGLTIPILWSHLSVAGAAVGLLLVFVLRPAVGWLALGGSALKGREKLVVAFYGVRGIGSIFYIAYAAGKLDLPNLDALWATVVFTILLSTLVHGLTAGIAVERVTGETLQPNASLDPARSRPPA